MTRRAGCQKATTKLSLRNSQSLSHLRYPTDIRQLTSPQGEADGVPDGGMTLQVLGGVNSPCDWYRIRGQPLTTGGQEQTNKQTVNEQLCVNNGSPAHYLLLVQRHPTTENTINVLANPA